MTRPARIRESEIKRAAKALGKAGVVVTGARITPDGAVELLTGEHEAANDRANPLDRVLRQ